MRRARNWVLFVVALAYSAPAMAWKPYTHSTTAQQAYKDAVDDGKVMILGTAYPVAPALVTALKNWPQYYNAGVIGPDGFPDLTFGQSVIHPGTVVPGAPKTGAWLAHILNSALADQNNSKLSAAEKQQILAFSFGFLTHGAGDMWGHTFVNDFARGVFPGVDDILKDPSRAAIALRHLSVEGYVGDATPGFDGFQDADDPRDARGPAPNGDVSDDSTPGFKYDAPHDFIYRTLIDPKAKTPSTKRGPLIDFYLLLESGLDTALGSNPQLLKDAVSAYDDTAAAFKDLADDCDFSSPLDAAGDAIKCPIGLAKLGIHIAIDSGKAFAKLVTDTLDVAAKVVFGAYVRLWIDDINDGLHHWSELGLGSTKAFFDPQTRRNLQNSECEHSGPDNTTSLIRANCEHGIGTLDVLLSHESESKVDDFINFHLLGMTGGPALDVIGNLRDILETIGDVVDDVLKTIGAPFNPLKEVTAEVKQYISNLIEDGISDVIGVDIDSLKDLLTHASHYTCLNTITFDFPVLGKQSITLFADGTHDQIDKLLGLPAGHHVMEDGIPLECGRLQDSAQIDMDSVAATANTIMMSKLLLLDGAQLNAMLGNILKRTITSYKDGQNVMTAGLTDTGVSSDSQWIQSIDSDHAWRKDGLPTFCEDGSPLCKSGVSSRQKAETGGAGNFPMWKSCVLRPAFRKLFKDWEGTGFPDLGDAAAVDPSNDPSAPTSTLVRTGTSFTSGSTVFVKADNSFTQTAQDTPAGKAFANDQLGLQRRIFTDPMNRGSFVDTMQGGTFKLTGPDRTYFIGVRSSDPCHGFSGPGAPEVEKVSQYVLDTTPPQLACPSPPFGKTYDTASTITLGFSLSDGTGSGVAKSSATVDGIGSQTGTKATTAGTMLDLFQVYPGTRHVSVSSADNLGNATSGVCTFTVHATVASLSADLTRAFNQGLITKQGIYTSLSQKLAAAQAAHLRNNSKPELNILGAFVHEIQAQRGKAVDAATTDRFIAFARDLIAVGG